MYLSCVTLIRLWPRWSAPILADSPSSSISECDPAAVLVSQGSPAAVLKGYLEAAGIEPVMVNTTDYALACEAFLAGVTDARITHSGQSILTEWCYRVSSTP